MPKWFDSFKKWMVENEVVESPEEVDEMLGKEFAGFPDPYDFETYFVDSYAAWLNEVLRREVDPNLKVRYTMETGGLGEVEYFLFQFYVRDGDYDVLLDEWEEFRWAQPPKTPEEFDEMVEETIEVIKDDLRDYRSEKK